MPLPNFHSARIQSPTLFVDGSIRTVTEDFPAGVSLLTGRPKGRSAKVSQAQAYRFEKSKFSATEAKAWLKEHKINYQLFEPAKDVEATKLSRASALELARSRTYKKDVLHTGTFTGEDGGTLEVTPERLVEIEQAFKDMQTNGVKVPIYGSTHQQAFQDTHDTNDAPARVAANCIGYISNALQDGEELELIHEFADDEAVKIAQRVQQVSACIEPDFVDGSGRHYPHAITHILLTPEPAVSAQSDFKEVACFSRASDSEEPATMLPAGDQSHGDVRDALQKVLDTENALADETVTHSLHAWVSDVYPDYIVCRAGKKLFKRSYTVGDDGVATLDGAELAEEVEEEERRFVPVNLSRGDPEMELKDLGKHLGLAEEADEATCVAEIVKLRARPEPPVQLSRESTEPLVEAAEHKLNKLIEDNKITPAAGEQLKAALIGADDARNAYALSRAVSGAEKALTFAVLDILNENAVPVATGAATGPQLGSEAVLLERPKADGTANTETDKARRQETEDEMVVEANKA